MNFKEKEELKKNQHSNNNLWEKYQIQPYQQK
jgi:hypothetical protein